MKRAIILHGTGGSPASNWFQWLKSELERRGYQVWLPELPRADRPSLRDSANFVRAHTPFPIDGQTLLIGHSSGAILALIVAQESPEVVGGVVAVSAFRNVPGQATGWEANGRLFDVDFDFDAIKAHAPKLLFVHSDNDPYVPLEQARFLADNCHGELVIRLGEGHFNRERNESYRRFPVLLELFIERHFV